MPCSWQCAGFGRPIYTNIEYPFAVDPPSVPLEENETGDYFRTFALPQHWSGRRIFLVLHGVDSACEVYVNGGFAGSSTDSRLPAEFDITRLVEAAGASAATTEHRVAVRVYRWSAGSYLEDQDQWWLSGLHRDVELYSLPAVACIRDFAVATEFSASEDLVGAGRTTTAEPPCRGVGRFSLSVALDSWLAATRNRLAPPDVAAPGLHCADPSPRCAASQDAAGGAFELNFCIVDDAGATVHAPPPLDVTELVLRAASSRTIGAGPATDSGVAADGEPAFCFQLAPVVTNVEIPDVRPWSAENPALYTLVIWLVQLLHAADARNERDRAGEGPAPAAPAATARSVLHVEAAALGFRTVRVVHGQLLVNGVAIYVYGANRHEHDDARGKAVPRDSTLADLLAMKRHNFNAVRCSHYPNDPSLYAMCDRLGMYVIDEANLETHGLRPRARLADEPTWTGAFVARAMRMAARDKNRPCIIAWSLGNETGVGRAHEEMAAALRPGGAAGMLWPRPLHFEPAVAQHVLRYDARAGMNVLLVSLSSDAETDACEEAAAAEGIKDGSWLVAPLTDILCPMYARACSLLLALACMCRSAQPATPAPPC